MAVLVQVTNRVLIDTWWNVNSRQQLSYFPEQFVLIDTWWNVNDERLTNRVYTLDVLIDTWWNVNKIILCEICLLIEF